jgi:nitrogenase molybdenum-iron protein beta chain
MGWIEKPRFSCVLGGALATLNALPRVVPIVHAAQGCGGNLHSAAFSGNGYFGSGYCGGPSMPSTNVLERDIVFGGVARLEEQIRTTFEVIDADLFVVATSCMTELIGDDVASITQEAARANPKQNIFSIETAGFDGNAYTGYERVVEGLFRCFIPAVPDKEKDPKLVNLFGIVPSYDPFFRGDLEEIRRILAMLGLRANTFFTPDQTIENIRDAGRASLNLNFSPVYGGAQLSAVAETHGIPSATLSLPVGAQATRRFIEQLRAHVGIGKKAAERAIAEEFRVYYAYVDRTLDLYADADFQHYAVVVSGANRALPYADFLVNEIGWIAKYIFVTDELDDAQRAAAADLAQRYDLVTAPELVFETNADRIAKHVLKERPQFTSDFYYNNNFSPAYILGSSLERELADILKANLLPVSFPVTNRLIVGRGYAGFRGGLALYEDLVSVLLSGR